MFGATKQAYYKYDKDAAMNRVAKEAFVVEYVHGIRSKCPGLGGPKLWYMYHEAFPKEARVGRDKFAEIIDRYNLKVRNKPRKPRTTDSGHGLRTFPNLVHSLIPDAPNQLWVSDITYIPLWPSESTCHFAYLSLISDAYTHEIIGWSLGPTLEARYPLKALRMAMTRLECMTSVEKVSLIHHSDRGVQYASAGYVSMLDKDGIRISMTENGDPKENALAERINNTVKNELLYGMRFRTMREVKAAISKGIDFYNNERPHMSNDMMTPAEAAHCHGLLMKWWHSYRDEAIQKEAGIV